MKKIFLILLFLLFTSLNSQATNYYFDLASGNDTTGDGTSGNPWKTIDKCTTSRTAGDECRGAKTAITTLAGTLTFTNGSTTVNTSNDLTAVVTAGDFVGKNSGLEGWHRVASLTSSAITLTYQYWGISGSGDAVTGYKITPVTASEEYDINSSGSEGSLITISGGWDLTGPTQDGITAFASTNIYAVDFNSQDFVKLSKFIIYTSSSYCVNVGSGSTDNEISDVFTFGTSGAGIYAAAQRLTLSNVTHVGGTGHGINFASTASHISLTNVYIFSAGTGGTDSGLVVSGMLGYFESVKVYNSYSFNLYLIGALASLNYFKDCEFSNSRGAGVAVICPSATTSCGTNNYFNSNTVNSNGTYGISLYDSGMNQAFFYNLTISSNATSDIRIPNNPDAFGVGDPNAVIQIGSNDPIMYFSVGLVEHDSSAECRSGKCLKFTPSNASFPIAYKIGSVKIPSADTDLTLQAYIKDDADFNGTVYFLVFRNGRRIGRTAETPTTSYTQETYVVDSTDLVVGDYLDLWIEVTGTAGNLYVDDFSADQ